MRRAWGQHRCQKRSRDLRVALLFACLLMVGFPSSSCGAEPPAAPTLVWDTMERVIQPRPGETTAEFQFTAVNLAVQPITIREIRSTCHCAITEMPRQPWVLAPNESGTFIGQINFRGLEGRVSKFVQVNTSAGTQMLRVTVVIPPVDESVRLANRALAQKDRQAVFRGECARCHVTPSVGQTGGPLFISACGVCHFATRRAPMVPDLLVAQQKRDAAYWRRWIREGKEGTLMPAWSKERGGPLTDEEIESLVQFALRTLPTEPRSEAKAEN